MWLCRKIILYRENVENKFVCYGAMSLHEDNNLNILFVSVAFVHHVMFCPLSAVRTQIIQPPVDTQVLLGHTATLQCKVSSDPTVPFHVDWFHNKE
jgi:hypothetical protein